jgi:hypothetical protein
VFGLKVSKNAISDKLHSVVPREVSVLIANGPSYAVGFLDAPESVYCQVSATLGTRSASANSNAVAVNPGPPQLAGPTRGDPRPAKPHIQPAVGVGGTNTCGPGDWRGNPTFSYAWGHRRQAGGQDPRASRLGCNPADSGQGRGRADRVQGEDHEQMGCGQRIDQQLPRPAERATIQQYPPCRDLHQSPSSDVVAGAAGGIGVAEVIDLTCEPGCWNRSDLSYSYLWSDDRWSGYVQAGQTLHLSMRPGQLQFEDTIHCQVTATTPHGLSNLRERRGAAQPRRNGCSQLR